ncbi:uncharacterized protein EHS24_002310 [Apiotrichum porosum]|uniref:Uncharacterized protein n=1 Tax=Apiotrichum porosum TaxID=105984 RepID=A0A427XIC8_9TREE|nr:uncharacterized protein EHS24_002310 [Apiotrichum porosum]RSH78582.1 hypothetical protein EHS24_002310 [Apiotrichum porosum]
MTISAPVLDKADPKSEKLYPFHLPFTEDWSEQKELFGSGTMMLAGSGMFMRNPLIVWTSMIMAVQAFVTQEPLRRKEDASSPLAMLGMAASGMIATSMGKVLLAPEAQGAAAAAAEATISAVTGA